MLANYKPCQYVPNHMEQNQQSDIMLLGRPGGLSLVAFRGHPGLTITKFRGAEARLLLSRGSP